MALDIFKTLTEEELKFNSGSCELAGLTYARTVVTEMTTSTEDTTTWVSSKQLAPLVGSYELYTSKAVSDIVALLL